MAIKVYKKFKKLSLLYNMSDSVFEYCPDHFRSVCSNYPFRCKSCRGLDGDPTKPLLFTSSSLLKKNHPAYKLKPPKVPKSVDKIKSKQVKRGFQNEKTLLKKTVRSGAVFGDGDLYFPDSELKIDSKVRHTDSLTFSLKKNEYESGKKQGIEAWAITHIHSSGDSNTVYMISEQAFIALLHLASVSHTT